MIESPRSSAFACAILLLAGLAAVHAAEPSSRPHAWKDVTGPIEWEGRQYGLYPKISDDDPGVPSPYSARGGIVTVTARLRGGTFTLVPVMLTEGQRFVNGEEFPGLARTGLHEEAALREKRVLAGRSIEEITRLGRPGGLSTAGFVAADEEIIPVLVADNRLVKALGLTHPELAEPLFHVINMMETDIGFVWRNHSWDDLKGLTYNGREILLTGKGTKGGQKSIFDDGVEGAWDLDIWRKPDAQELAFLEKKYAHLGEESLTELLERLSHVHTGEMVPQYIMRYGFYEGHTGYRADPIAIAFIFGLRTVEEIEDAFPGGLPDRLAAHYTTERIGRSTSGHDELVPTVDVEREERPFIGIEMGPSNDGGTTVDRVIPDSAAERFGLEAGDVILRIDDTPTGSPRGVSNAIASLRPGDVVEIELIRAGERRTIQLELGRRPDELVLRRERADHVLEVLRIRPGQAVADIGCGSGWLSEAIAIELDGRGTVYAVELEEEHIESLRLRELPGIVPVLSEAGDVSLPENSVDIAMLHDVASHIDPDTRKSFYESVRRALRPGGRLVVFGPHGDAGTMLEVLRANGFAPLDDDLVGQSPEDLDRRLNDGIAFGETAETAP